MQYIQSLVIARYIFATFASDLHKSDVHVCLSAIERLTTQVNISALHELCNIQFVQIHSIQAFKNVLFRSFENRVKRHK